MLVSFCLVLFPCLMAYQPRELINAKDILLEEQ